jgi:hypothetical protein
MNRLRPTLLARPEVGGGGEGRRPDPCKTSYAGEVFPSRARRNPPWNQISAHALSAPVGSGEWGGPPSQTTADGPGRASLPVLTAGPVWLDRGSAANKHPSEGWNPRLPLQLITPGRPLAHEAWPPCQPQATDGPGWAYPQGSFQAGAVRPSMSKPLITLAHRRLVSAKI